MGIFTKKKTPKDKKSDRDKKKTDKERQWSDVEEPYKFVNEKGKVECPFCSNPIGGFKVTSNTISLQDAPYVTTADKDGKVNLDFKGNCLAAPGITKPPCKSVIALAGWTNYSDTKINNDNALLVRSTIKCTYGNIDIKIVDSGQITVLEEIEPKVIEYEVEKIKLITELEDGSDNILNSKSTQKGMIWGETYTFEVEKYVNDKPPINKQQIKWQISYIDEEGTVVIMGLKKRGDKIKLKIDDKEWLGKKLTITSYIHSDTENIASFDVWIHYRFRWISRETLIDQVAKIMSAPHTIDQSRSSLCGFAFIGYHFARLSPSAYETYVKDMHRTGEATIEATSYTVKIDNDEHLVDLKPSDPRFPMSEADYILLVTLRDDNNAVWDYDGDAKNAGGFVEGLTGMTFPDTVEKLMKNVLGLNTIEDETNIAFSEWKSAENSVKNMQKKLNDGYIVGWFINTNPIVYSKKGAFSTPDHWVGLESISISGDTISYRIYTWGGYQTGSVNIDFYKDGNYGYVAGK